LSDKLCLPWISASEVKVIAIIEGASQSWPLVLYCHGNTRPWYVLMLCSQSLDVLEDPVHEKHQDSHFMHFLSLPHLHALNSQA
jgi:hypothetical protein